MRQKLRANRELFVLIGLFAVFLVAVSHYKQAGNETLPRTTPSSLNAKAPGAMALFLLLSKEGFRTDRLEASWRSLRDNDRLVIIIEPLLASRAPSREEVAALKSWIAAGGTAFYSVTAPARPLDPNDPLAGDIAIVPGSEKAVTIPVAANRSSYGARLLGDVKTISMRCPVRLSASPTAGYDVLLNDTSGAILLHKQIGKGHLVVAADQDLTSNSAIVQADNVVLMINLAELAVGRTGHNVEFDEYHHGAGFEGNDAAATEGLWNNAPMPVRLALLDLLALTSLLVYNGNRRFGRPHSIGVPAARASTDYIGSMARLYRRSESADIAIQTLATNFRRDLTRCLALSPDAPIEQIVDSAHRTYGIEAQPLGTLLYRIAQIDSGARISEQEMMACAADLDLWRRRFELVGA